MVSVIGQHGSKYLLPKFDRYLSLHIFALFPSPEKSKGMADKAEKDLDQASDCGWVRGLDANGNPIKIAKADLVELIRREMPVATIGGNGLLSSIFYGYIFNSPVSNTYTEGENQIPTVDIDGSSGQVPLGAYYINPDPNCSLFGKGDGMLITLRRSFLTAQLYFARSGLLYLRTASDFSNFNSWKQISFT